MDRIITLETYLAETGTRPDLSRLVMAIAEVAGALSERIARGGLGGALGTELGTNSDGDGQKALDLMADEAFAAALAGGPVRWLASEEREEVTALAPDGPYAVAIDPLDGSSNIDVNVSIGTIFSVRPARADGRESFLGPGHEQLAAGYVIYGPQTALVLTCGGPAALFLRDPRSGRFLLAESALRIASGAREFAINASNYRHWPRPVRAYVDDCMAGDAGPLGRNYNMRWIASLVAETHRILMRGGVFLYPADAREGYARGRLRLVYECAPIAMIIAAAGGLATDGADPILDRIPAGLHDRTPFVFGSADKVARVAAYHDLPEAEISPLFGQRGLFKV